MSRSEEGQATPSRTLGFRSVLLVHLLIQIYSWYRVNECKWVIVSNIEGETRHHGTPPSARQVPQSLHECRFSVQCPWFSPGVLGSISEYYLANPTSVEPSAR